MSTIGLLPHLTDEQLSRLEQMTEGMSSTVEPILKHMLLYIVDEDSYSEDKEVTIDELREWYTDTDLLRALLLQWTDEERYADTMQSAINRYTSRSRIQPLDLALPSRIPSDYSEQTRSRVRDIMSVLYRTRQRSDDVIGPYEITMNLERLHPGTGASANIYLAKYMNQQPMILKTSSADSMMNEYLVGIVMNRLRADIPNFVYTYGYSANNYIVELPNSNDAYYSTYLGDNHSVYVEYIENALVLYNIEASNTAEVIVSDRVIYEGTNYIRLILFQILCALIYAHYRVGFVHSDLNLGNILLVHLPSPAALPIMVPVSNTKFEKRYIVTNLLVMIIDYGHSTAVDRSIYRYKHLISPDSLYRLYTGNSALSNDIAMLVSRLSELVSSKYHNHTQVVNDIYSDIHSILYRLYTGQRLLNADGDPFYYMNQLYTEHGSSHAYYYRTHPRVQYDPYGAVIDFCSRYSHLFTSTSTGEYSSILSSMPNSTVTLDSRDTLDSIDSTRTYYWYERYAELKTIPLDIDSISANEWYRSEVLNSILPYSTHLSQLSNERLIEAVSDHIGTVPAIHMLYNMYYYISYFWPISLNILPFSYSTPEDIFSAITRVLPSLE